MCHDVPGVVGVMLCRKGCVSGFLELHNRELCAILRALLDGYRIEGTVSHLYIHKDTKSGNRLVKGKLAWALLPLIPYRKL